MQLELNAKIGHILIVEDEPESLALIRNLFPSDSYSTSAAGNASEAIRLLEQGHFDVGVFDLRIPQNTDGIPTNKLALEVLRVARQRQPLMKMITISSVFVDEQMHSSLDELGIIKNFEKPFAFLKLRDEVASQING